MLSGNSLHLFSGSTKYGVSVDRNVNANPTVVADFNHLPFYPNTFDAVLADPPYADHWQKQWGGDLPQPKQILRAASRVVRRGGLIGILHIIVIPCYKEFNIERVAIHPILCGPNNVLRAFNVYRKL